MRRLVPIALLLARRRRRSSSCSPPREGDEPYRVRAIFDNAGFVIPGEDVKVAGVKVGKISALDVTRDFKAVVVLDIEDAAYQDFRRDAECSIRPQSLIGERFVECEPTQKRAPGAQEEPELETIDDGPGRGPAPAAGREHEQARRPRPDQQHHARARARPAVDHPQRAGHRRRRPRAATSTT